MTRSRDPRLRRTTSSTTTPPPKRESDVHRRHVIRLSPGASRTPLPHAIGTRRERPIAPPTCKPTGPNTSCVSTASPHHRGHHSHRQQKPTSQIGRPDLPQAPTTKQPRPARTPQAGDHQEAGGESCHPTPSRQEGRTRRRRHSGRPVEDHGRGGAAKKEAMARSSKTAGAPCRKTRTRPSLSRHGSSGRAAVRRTGFARRFPPAAAQAGGAGGGWRRGGGRVSPG